MPREYLSQSDGRVCDERSSEQGWSRQPVLYRDDYQRFDLLIGMDTRNLRNMNRICGGDPERKIHLLLDYTNRPGDVADPWYTGNFEATWRDVIEGCTMLLKDLTDRQ